MKTIVNSGFHQILGTDRFDKPEEPSERYKEYRRKWAENPQNQIVGEFPLHIDTEATNGCNLKCIMCTRNFMTERVGCMDLGLFKKVINEGAEYGLPSIKLNFRGEPLIHPKLPEMVKYAKDKGIMEVQFNSNGMLLTEKKSEELIKAGLDNIIFSCDGATRETFNKIRAGAEFDTVVSNIKKFVEIRNSMGLKKPTVRVQMVKMKENAHELELFVKLWKDTANRIAFMTKREPFEKKEVCGSVVHREQFPCYQIWQRIVVWWTGEVVMCCGDWHGGYIIGDAKKQSIYELWHGEKYNKVRELHAKHRFNEIKMCSRCEINTRLVDKDLDELVSRYERPAASI